MGLFDDVRQRLFGAVDGEQPAELQSPQDQPKEDQDLVSYVKQKVEEVRTQSVRTTHEGIWMTNIAYCLGFDNVYYDPTMRTFRPLANTGAQGQQFLKKNRIHSNLLLPGMQNRLARMLKVPPRYDVRPNSMTEEDKEAARLGVEVIGSVWDRQKVNRKRIDLGMWVQQCGHAYVGVSFDDQIGDPLCDPQTGEMLGYEGDVRIDVVSAFEGFCDPLAKTFEEAGWFARAKVRKLDYFRSHYPERGHLVKEESAWLLSTQYEMRINTMNTLGSQSSEGADQMKGAAIEISYYEKRSQKYPQGRHVVIANGVMLKNDELPVGEIPYAKFDDVIIGGKYYSEALITHARPLQDQYNRTLTKRSQWVNRLLAGKYLAAKQHHLIREAFNDQSAEIIEYDPVPGAAEPHAIQLPVIPQYAYQESQELKKEIYDLMGLSEVSRGNIPSASIPGIGLQLLLEQDETRMGIEVEAQEHSYARVGMLILKYVDKYFHTTRKLKTKNSNLEYNIKEYDGKSLRKNFDVVVIRGSTVPNSKTLHRQEIINLYQQGLLGDPSDQAVKDKVLSMLQYGEVGEVWEDRHLDMAQIQKDIEMIEAGERPNVDPKDNHILHMIHKNRYRKSDKYERLTPYNQDLLQANILEHSKYAVEQTNPHLATPPPDPPPPPSVPMGGLPPRPVGMPT